MTPFPLHGTAQPQRCDDVAASGLSWRDACEGDLPFLRALYASFRSEEMALVPWPQAQKDAFLNDQFRLQHHHFVSYFSSADFWIVQRSEPADENSLLGRFYLDRSTPLWRVVDIGFLPRARGQGIGSALLKWAQLSAREVGAAGIDLHVVTVNTRAQALYRRLGFRPEGEAEGYHQRMVWRPS